MKTLNPFDRLKKWNDVPVSLFPCSKVTRTSMPIGRAVPLYTIEMMQGNHIKLDVSQLTRFMSMSAPVMQNYEITFGAFYCPYVALDDYTDISKIFGSYKAASGVNFLRARQFFNPDTDNSQRVYPYSISYAARAAQSFSGSIFDHLQYKTFTDINLSELGANGGIYFDNSGYAISNKYLTSLILNASDEEVMAASWGIDPSSGAFSQYWCHRLNWDASQPGTSEYWDVQPDSNRSVYALPFGAWLQAKYGTNSDARECGQWLLDNASSSIQHYNPIKELQASGSISNNKIDNMCLSLTYMASAWCDITDTTDPFYRATRYTEVFGTDKRVDIINSYFEYLRGVYASVVYSGIVESSVPWLIYHRIYADWFLPENFIDYEDYIAMIGSAYCHRSQNPTATMTSAFTPAATLAAGNAWLNQSANGAKICKETFAEYCRKGECMPVLWSKDQFTGLMPNEKAQATPLGSSIEEHLYQRMLAKFKDLINRIGHDYRHNTAALYGSSVSDSTLLRSQVIGYRSFDVSIGDVAQTSKTDSDSTLGQFAGYAVSRDNMGSFEWTAEENGMIMVLAWVRPKYTAITSSRPRYLLKSTYGDYLNPLFGGVGRQPVTFGQLDATGGAQDSNVFGWQERYFEYMMVDNECSGAMRNIYKHYNADRTLPTTPTSLTNLTNLKFLYMTEQDDLHRVFVDTLSDPVLISAFFEGNVTRQLPSSIRTDF